MSAGTCISVLLYEMAETKRSKLSLRSVKSVVEKVPRTKACPWVAQWFTIPQAVVKALQFILSVLVIVFLLIWNSGGLTIADLNTGELNYRNIVYGFVGLGALSCIYSVGFATAGLTGLKIPALLQSLFSVFILLTWLIASPVMSASVEELTNTPHVRLNAIDTQFLTVATGLGFGLLAVCLIDAFLGFQSIRRIDQESNKEFTREMSQSKSVMMAVHSGQSFSEAKRTTSSRSVAAKPVDETSPLKSHEVGQGSNTSENRDN